MKFFWSSFLLFSSALWAQTTLTAQDMAGLTDRFVTTIKETKVDGQMLSVPTIRQCVDSNKITEADIKDGKSVEKREKAKKCLNDAMAKASEADLQTLADQLKLDQFGLVKGKSSQVLINFFGERIQNALYGVGAGADDLKRRDRTVVDHKVFTDIYQSRLTKNFLLDVSRYCYQDLLPITTNNTVQAPGTLGYFSVWEQILTPPEPGKKAVCDLSQSRKDLVDNCLNTRMTDASSKELQGTPTDIYQDLAEKLDADPNDPTNTTAGKKRVERLFVSCLKMISPLCEYKTYCDERNKQGADPVKVNQLYPDFATANCNGNKGAKSCAMQEKIRAYRINLAALQQIESVAPVSEEAIGDFALKNPDEIYRADNAQNGRTIEDMTTVTTKDMKGALDKANKDYEQKFDQFGCEQNPEKKECEKFFYSDEEAVKFANQGILYDAATAREKAQISKLRGKELKDYLKEKGYGDLEKELADGTISETDIVTKAQARFAAERNASYASMENAFKDKQTILDSKEKLEEKGKEAVQKYKTTNNQFNQLLLFNNVITSFLQIQDNRTQELNTNTDVLRRELAGVDSQALEFFQNLGGTGSAGGSSKSNTGKVEIGLDQIDSFLSGAGSKSDEKLD